MFSKSTLIKIAVNTLIGIILIAIWLKFVNIQEIWQTILTVSPISLIPVIFFMLLGPIIRAIRFKIFLKPIKEVGTMDMIFLNGASILFNFFIPVRAGEILKGVYLNNRYNIPIAKSLVLVFLDRYLDFLVVLVMGAILLLFIPTSLSEALIKLITIVFLVGIMLTYLLTYRPNLALKLASIIEPILIFRVLKVYYRKIINFFLETFKVFKRSPKELAILILITLVAYLADSFIWVYMFSSLGSDQSLIKMYLAQLLSALTYLIPAAPGYVGSTEASGILVFTGIFGIDKNLTASMIVLFHILTAVSVLVFGIISVYFLSIDTFGILKKAFKRE